MVYAVPRLRPTVRPMDHSPMRCFALFLRSLACVASMALMAPGIAQAAKPKVKAPPAEPLVIEQGGKHGVADRSGKLLLAPTYPWIGDFVGGVAPFEIKEGAESRFGLLNRKGKVQVKAAFEGLRDFAEGKAPVRIGGLWGYANATGKAAIAPKFQRVLQFSEDRAGVEVLQDKWAFIDPTGTVVFELAEYETGELDRFSQGVVVLLPLKQGNARVVDKAGKVVCEAPSRTVKGFSDGLAAFRSDDGRWGFIDLTCKVVIPPTFAFTAGFREGLAPTEQDGRWGFVDKNGKWVVEPIFGDIEALSEGLARVRVGTLYGYCDSAGRTVIAPIYDDAQHAGTRFRNGVALVGKETDGRLERGWIDKTGAVVWAPWPPPKKEE